MQSSSELYQILKNNIDSTGLPIIPEGQFQNLTQEFGRDTFRETLAEFIFKERPKICYTSKEVWHLKFYREAQQIVTCQRN